MKAAVLIVTHNSEGHIGPCLESLSVVRASTGASHVPSQTNRPRPGSLDLEILVVDNASADSTVAIAQRYPGVRVVPNAYNRGFAGAVNQGFRLTAADLVLVLNPDTIFVRGFVELAQACQKFGISTGCLTAWNGEPQRGFAVRRFPTTTALCFEALGVNRLLPGNPSNNRYRHYDMDFSRAQIVEQPAGAMLMIRRDVWSKAGGFDERFHPVWFEDVDFCKRARALGFQIWYTPEARAAHCGAHSVGQMPPSDRVTAWYGSLLRYAAKHQTRTELRLLCASVGAGCAARWIADSVLRRKSASPPKAGGGVGYGAVIRSAVSTFWSGRVEQRAEPFPPAIIDAVSHGSGDLVTNVFQDARTKGA